MIIDLNVFFIIQGVNTTLAVIFNLFLAYLAIFKCKNRHGSYQTIVIVYALFEALYAIVTFIGMPVHFVSNGTWIVFNNHGLLANTSFSFLGPSLFCIFYQIWIILIVSHFVCRYICVCKPALSMNIKNSDGLKRLIFGFFIFMTIFALTCGMFFCTRLTISQNEHDSILHDYNLPIEDSSSFGYILLRPKELDGTISLIGLTTILNHYMLVTTSFIIISFCTLSVLREVANMKKFGSARKKKDATSQIEILVSLMIQTAVPFIFCHVPSVIFLSFPFLESNFSFGQFSLIFTWTTTAVKFIDPLIVMSLVPTYRRAALCCLGFRAYQQEVSSIQPRTSALSSNVRSIPTDTGPTETGGL